MPAEAAMFEALVWVGVAASLLAVVLTFEWCIGKAEQDLFGDDKGEWQ